MRLGDLSSIYGTYITINNTQFICTSVFDKADHIILSFGSIAPDMVTPHKVYMMLSRELDDDNKQFEVVFEYKIDVERIGVSSFHISPLDMQTKSSFCMRAGEHLTYFYASKVIGKI